MRGRVPPGNRGTQPPLPADASASQGCFRGRTAASTDAAPAAASPAPQSASSPAAPAAEPRLAASPSPTVTAPEQINILENADIKVTFTTHGASIKTVDLKKHHEGRNGGGDVVLNEQSHDNILATQGWPGADSTAFHVEATPNSLTYTTTLSGDVNWTRTYTLGTGYLITVRDTFANTGAAEAMLPAYSLSLGRAEPLLVKGQYQPISSRSVGAAWLTTKNFHLTTVDAFNPSGWITKTARARHVRQHHGRSQPDPLAGRGGPVLRRASHARRRSTR